MKEICQKFYIRFFFFLTIFIISFHSRGLFKRVKSESFRDYPSSLASGVSPEIKIVEFDRILFMGFESFDNRSSLDSLTMKTVKAEVGGEGEGKTCGVADGRHSAGKKTVDREDSGEWFE
ncbi:hypothetical protein Pyn_09274 [Prunus yedoensis var. nudiflora]|uniref:Uncharacterized protein n=1 Tax=Prunus yedoensis var. nudiflora TaxID=2094558 RepID=A0A314UVC2_PRUYE|nr:hypothetical protein Pyn_09274 [Prunus yedoensis var. nudiflora]